MIVKRYSERLINTRTRKDGPITQARVGWYLFGFIPLYVADL